MSRKSIKNLSNKLFVLFSSTILILVLSCIISLLPQLISWSNSSVHRRHLFITCVPPPWRRTIMLYKLLLQMHCVCCIVWQRRSCGIVMRQCCILGQHMHTPIWVLYCKCEANGNRLSNAIARPCNCNRGMPQV